LNDLNVLNSPLNPVEIVFFFFPEFFSARQPAQLKISRRTPIHGAELKMANVVAGVFRVRSHRHSLARAIGAPASQPTTIGATVAQAAHEGTPAC